MERTELQKRWDEAWESGLWAAPWKKLLEGLSPEDAAWSPQPQRHSIWQIVNHMIFWREEAIRRFNAGQPSTDEEIARRNFESPAAPTQVAWSETTARFSASQQRVRSTMAEAKTDIDKIRYLLAHDMYHQGQVAYLRAMRGKPTPE
ncbi:DinB superfamily protein [Phycisphaerae bacterium RAS1]|nr:DinB superfamily protein [Phycisphaerae bacterium RAS1]